MARNQDHVSFYKYGDIIDIPIKTNLEGVQLANNIANDFLAEQTVELNDYSNRKKIHI